MLDEAVKNGDQETIDDMLEWATQNHNPWLLCLKYPHLTRRLLERVPFWDTPQPSFLNHTLNLLSTVNDHVKDNVVQSFQLVVSYIETPNMVSFRTWNRHIKEIARIIVQNNPRDLAKILCRSLMTDAPDVIEYALSHGCSIHDLRPLTMSQHNPWDWFVMALNSPSLEIFLRHGVDPNIKNPYMPACQLIHDAQTAQDARLLIQYGANPEYLSPTDTSVYFLASRHPEVVRICLEYGLDPIQPESDLCSPLYTMCFMFILYLKQDKDPSGILESIFMVMDFIESKESTDAIHFLFTSDARKNVYQLALEAEGLVGEVRLAKRFRDYAKRCRDHHRGRVPHMFDCAAFYAPPELHEMVLNFLTPSL